MAAYTVAGPIGLSGDDIIDATTSGYRWLFSGPAVLNWSVSSSKWIHPSLQSPETQEDFARALSSIAEFIPVQFNFLGYAQATASLTGYQVAAANGSNVNISFSYAGFTQSGQYLNDGMFSSGGQTAIGFFPDSDINTVYTGATGDVWLNYNNPFIASLTFEFGTNGYALLIHELLHAIGLKHPHDDGGTGRPTYTSLGITYADRQWISVMSYDRLETGGDGAYTGSMPVGPMLFDAIALQYLYGESQFNAGGTNYDLRFYLGNYFNCQWDASGVDTLDGSGLGYGFAADLGYTTASNGRNSHHVGFVTTAEDYLSLSYSNPQKWTWLWGEYENLSGSAYRDVLIGNDLDNSIQGGSGDDYLSGGGGNDTFDWDASMRGGADTMEGGAGDDVYVVDSVLDVIFENDFEGIDTVWVGFSYSLEGKAVENIGTLSGLGTGVTLTGNYWANEIHGGSGSDRLMGLGGDDMLIGNSGNDTLDGGAGLDYAAYTTTRASSSITKSIAGFQVRNSDGTDLLQGIERVAFSDVFVALDIDGNGGQAYRLYQAAFNRTPDQNGLGYQMNALDIGLSLVQVAGNFIASPEFQQTYGALNNAQFVTQLYANVLHRSPDGGGLEYHTDHLEHGFTRADILVGFSESPENQAALIGVIGNGMIYTWAG